MKKATAFYFKLNNNKMYGVGSANYNGSVMNFDYTGSVQTATLAPGTYKLECWGAQGGNGSSNGNSNINAVAFFIELFILVYSAVFLHSITVIRQ